MKPTPRIQPATQLPHDNWLALRMALWPDADADEHLAEMASLLAEPERYLQLLAYDGAGRPLGLIEAAVRHDYVNGTETSPVLFLEGLYVTPPARRRGVAAALVRAAADWGRARGLHELASDTTLDNTSSQAVHRALGFAETERVVFFRVSLDD